MTLKAARCRRLEAAGCMSVTGSPGHGDEALKPPGNAQSGPQRTLVGDID
jgi:hypothetical protein